MKTKTNKKNGMKNERGSTLVGALLAILMLGYFGSTVVAEGAGDYSSSTNDFQADQALYAGNAGLQYAYMQLKAGYSPDITDKDFGDGSFTITSDPEASLVMVDGDVGEASKNQQATYDFSQNCVELDASSVYISGKEIYDLKMTKTCNDAAHVTKMWIEWDFDECTIGGEEENECDFDGSDMLVKHIGVEGTAIYNPGLGIGTPGGGGAESGEEIDVENYTMNSDGNYVFEGPPHGLRFSDNLPDGSFYKITIEFADGSQISATFQASEGEDEEEDEDEDEEEEDDEDDDEDDD